MINDTKLECKCGDSGVAWVIAIGARGGLQFCRHKSREMPDTPFLITPFCHPFLRAAQGGPPPPPFLATPLCGDGRVTF